MPKVIIFYDEYVTQDTQISLLRKKKIPFFGYNNTHNGYVRALSDNHIDFISLTDEGDYIPADKDISKLAAYTMYNSTDELRADKDLIELIEAEGPNNSIGSVVEVEKGRAFFVRWNEDDYCEEIIYHDNLKWFSL